MTQDAKKKNWLFSTLTDSQGHHGRENGHQKSGNDSGNGNQRPTGTQNSAPTDFESLPKDGDKHKDGVRRKRSADWSSAGIDSKSASCVEFISLDSMSDNVHDRITRIIHTFLCFSNVSKCKEASAKDHGIPV